MNRTFETREIANQANYAREHQPENQRDLISAFEVTGLFFGKPKGRESRKLTFENLHIPFVQADVFIPAFEEATDTKLEHLDDKARYKVHKATLSSEDRLTTTTLNAWHVETTDESDIYLTETQEFKDKPQLHWVRAKVE